MTARRILSFLLAAALVPLPIMLPAVSANAVAIAGATRYEQDTPGISWTAGWNQVGTSVASGGSRAVTRSATATLTATFSGTGVALVGERGPAWGKANISVDGKLVKTVDLYASGTQRQATIFRLTGLAAGSHRVTLAAIGKKNPSSRSTQVNLDAIDVLGTLTPTLSMTRVEQDDKRLFFDGPWKHSTNSAMSGGSYRWASGGAAEASFEFRGRAVALIGTRGGGYGRAEVFIDGASQGVVSAYSPALATRRILFARSGLADRDHTMTVRVLGTHESAATGSAFGVDAFEVWGTPKQSWTRVEDGDARITRAGSLSRADNASMSGGSYTYASTAGAVVRARFTGSAMRIVAPKGASYGQIEVVVDGVSRLVDLYASSLRARQRVLTLSGMEPTATHEVEIRVPATKSASASWHSATFDAIDVRGTMLQAPTVRAFSQLEEDDPRVELTGRWRTTKDAKASRGRVASVLDTGQTAQVRFVGTGFRWIAPRTPASGKARILVDGELIGATDLYAPSALARQVVFTKGGLTEATHTVTIESLGTKHADSTGTGIGLDSIQVTGVAKEPPHPSAWKRLEQNNPAVVRTGYWTNTSVAAASGGSHSITRDALATTVVRFRGTEISWIGSRAKSYGAALVYLDGRLVATLDDYDYLTDHRRVLWRATGLADAEHTVKIVPTTYRATGSSYWVPVDAFEIQGEPLQAVSRFDQSDYRARWSGSWSTVSRTGSSGGTVRKAAKSGAATVTFYGTRFDLVSAVGPSWGKARVSIDGGPGASVDLYRTKAAEHIRVYSKGGLAAGRHTAVVSWTGSRNAAATSSAINVDAFDLGGDLLAVTPVALARQKIVRTAIDQLGKPYVWAADGPESFDCSGLVMYCYRQVGIGLPHYSGAQWDLCSPRNIGISSMVPGDLAFSSSPSYIHHVGLYIGQGLTINAPGSGRKVEYRRADTYGCFGRIRSSMWQ